jgi:hypothetical protein
MSIKGVPLLVLVKSEIVILVYPSKKVYEKNLSFYPVPTA